MAADEDGRTWRDDVAADRAFEFLDRALIAAALAEIEMPHIVICTDPQTGAQCFSGPYRNGFIALRVAERDALMDEAAGGDPMTYGVAALLPVGGEDA